MVTNPPNNVFSRPADALATRLTSRCRSTGGGAAMRSAGGGAARRSTDGRAAMALSASPGYRELRSEPLVGNDVHRGFLGAGAGTVDADVLTD
jgi:hypothetical protein